MASVTVNSKFAGHAELPGVRLWYTDSGGNGVPLLLLHANTGNADGWQYNIPGFVEAGYRAIAIDVGTKDPFLTTNTQLDQALTRLGVAHTFETYDGDHGNRITELGAPQPQAAGRRPWSGPVTHC